MMTTFFDLVNTIITKLNVLTTKATMLICIGTIVLFVEGITMQSPTPMKIFQVKHIMALKLNWKTTTTDNVFFQTPILVILEILPIILSRIVTNNKIWTNNLAFGTKVSWLMKYQKQFLDLLFLLGFHIVQL